MGIWTSGKPPAYAGTDFIVARNGRIASVYLFFDNLPQSKMRHADTLDGERVVRLLETAQGQMGYISATQCQ
jgi:hypothetical protein